MVGLKDKNFRFVPVEEIERERKMLEGKRSETSLVDQVETDAVVRALSSLTRHRSRPFDDWQNGAIQEAEEKEAERVSGQISERAVKHLEGMARKAAESRVASKTEVDWKWHETREQAFRDAALSLRKELARYLEDES